MAIDFSAILKGLADSNAAAAASDPYAPLGSVADSLSKIILQDSATRPAATIRAGGKYNPWEDIIAGGITGGLSGLFGGLGQNYRNDQNALSSAALEQLINGGPSASLLRPDGMAPEVWHSLQNVNDAMKIASMSHKQDLLDAEVARNPTLSPIAQQAVAPVLAKLGIDPATAGSLKAEDWNAIKEAAGAIQKDQPKPLTAQAAQKLATAQSLIKGFDDAISMTKDLTPNPSWTDSIPLVGGALGDYIGGAERGILSHRNTTPEGQYDSYLQSLQEGAGKFISNSARQRIIDANLDLVRSGRAGSPEGAAAILKRTRDMIAEDLVDQGANFSEQDFRTVKGAVADAQSALSGGSDQPPPDAVAQAQAEGFKIVGRNPNTGKWLVAPDTSVPGSSSSGDW